MRDLVNARMLAVAPSGTAYLTRREEADVLALTDADADGDGRADQVRRVPANLALVNGIAIRGDQLWVSSTASASSRAAP